MGVPLKDAWARIESHGRALGRMGMHCAAWVRTPHTSAWTWYCNAWTRTPPLAGAGFKA